MGINGGWQAARNILCVRLDSMGDVLMTSPAIRALKLSRPDRIITLLASKAGASCAPLIEDIDQTLVYDPPWMKARGHTANGELDREMVERLRHPGFEAAIIFTTFSQSPLAAALLTFLADIPLRLAYCRENPYQLLTDWLPETDREEHGFSMRHEVRRQLDLVQAIGSVTANEAIALAVPPAALERVHGLLAQAPIDLTRPWLIMHPGASAASRRYPERSFAEAADLLADRHGFQVLFTGSPAEIELIERIRRLMGAPSCSVAGKLDIEELGAAISLAPVLICNNSGPAHLAAGVQTPVVDIYALTNPQHMPWMVPHRTLYHDVPCRFCYKSTCPMQHHHCLRLIPPQSIVEAALELARDVNVRAPAG